MRSPQSVAASAVCPTYRRSTASARGRPKADRQARQLQRLVSQLRGQGPSLATSQLLGDATRQSASIQHVVNRLRQSRVNFVPFGERLVQCRRREQYSSAGRNDVISVSKIADKFFTHRSGLIPKARIEGRLSATRLRGIVSHFAPGFSQELNYIKSRLGVHLINKAGNKQADFQSGKKFRAKVRQETL